MNESRNELKAELEAKLRAQIEADADVTVFSPDGIYMGIDVSYIVEFCLVQITENSKLPNLTEVSNMTNGSEIAKLFNKDALAYELTDDVVNLLATMIDMALKEAYECGQNEAVKLAQKIADRK